MLGRSPPVGLWPTMPLKKHGLRIDPPTSTPSPIALPPAPMIAPSPPLDPPEICRTEYALFVLPYSVLCVSNQSPASETFVSPTMMHPAFRIRATSGASSLPTTWRREGTPAVNGSPSTLISSLIVEGTPKNGGKSSFGVRRIVSSAWRAFSRARSNVGTATALRSGFTS